MLSHMPDTKQSRVQAKPFQRLLAFLKAIKNEKSWHMQLKLAETMTGKKIAKTSALAELCLRLARQIKASQLQSWRLAIKPTGRP